MTNKFQHSAQVWDVNESPNIEKQRHEKLKEKEKMKEKLIKSKFGPTNLQREVRAI